MTVRRHGGAGFGIVLLVVVGASCGGGDGAQPGPSSAPPAAETTESPSGSAPTTTEPATTADRAATTGTPSSSMVGPADRCPVGALPAVFAYDIGSGAERWATCGEGDTQRFLHAATDELAFLVEQPAGGTAPARPPALVALDAGDGSERWRRELLPTGRGVAPGPFLAGGIVVATVDEDGAAVAGLDAGSGAVVWSVPTDELTRVVAVTDRVVVVHDDAIVDPGPQPMATDGEGRLVPPTSTFELRGYDRATGAPMWTTVVDRSPLEIGMIGAGVSDETVVLTPGPYRLDATTGQIGWRTTGPTTSPPIGAIVDGVVLTGTLDDPTTALDLATGAERWTRPGSAPYAGFFAAGDGAVFVTDRTDLIAYELTTGTERWRQPNVPEDYAWPWHVADDTLFTMWWNLEARSTGDGSVRWATDYPVGDVPTGPTPRMISIATNTTLVLVSFYRGTLGGD